MSIRETTKKVIITVATAGLSTCNNNGAVDPAPPPLTCDANTQAGGTMSATGSLSGSDLTITLSHSSNASWQGTPQVDQVTGATLGGVTQGTGGTLTVTLTLASPTTTSVSFRFNGTLQGYGSGTCAVTRTFQVTISGTNVTVAAIDRLPLGESQRLTIDLLRQHGGEVELAARGATMSATLEWSVTGGSLTALPAGGVRWALPREPGIYQIELAADHGRLGVSFDTLTLEVSGRAG